MTKIYTRTGDDGTTGLIGGRRVAKDSLRIDAYGTVDELNAVLGVTRSYTLPERVDQILQAIQDELFMVGALLALPEGDDPGKWEIPLVTDKAVSRLEREIDEIEKQLEPLRKFILPGGSTPGACLHLARTIARRAERGCVALLSEEKLDPQIIRYLNRLSDLLFVLARHVNRGGGLPESHPTFGKPQTVE